MDATPGPELGDPGSDGQAADEVELSVRRTPRYGTFLIIGALLGVLVGWLLTELASGRIEADGQVVDTGAVLGLVIVMGAVGGLALGAIVALVVDRVLARRLRTVVAQQVARPRGDDAREQ